MNLLLYYILASFKWMLSSALLYGVLFLGLGFWIKKLIKLKELQEASNLVQVFLRVSMCLLPVIITTMTYRYAHFITTVLTPPPKEHLAYIEVELSIQPFLSIGIGACTSLFFLWYFVFRTKSNQ